MKLTSEQQTIIEHLVDGKSVIVDAVAGSGKTFTIQGIVDRFPSKTILVMMYNRILFTETQNRIRNSNTLIGTIHSLAGNFYGVPCPNDEALKTLKGHSYLGSPFDLIIIDEAQDLTSILVRTIRQIVTDSSCSQLCILGDTYQSIYEFNGADSRFLSLADDPKLFGGSGIWVRCNLSETFRCTQPMVDFINDCVLHQPRMVSHKSGVKPIYLTGNIFELHEDINRMVDGYLNVGYSYQDIAILAYSLRNERTPVNKVANCLSARGKILYKPHDESTSDNRLMAGKLVISTIHQFKGLQRKIIFLIGGDSGFPDSSIKCPNPLYVALTRAEDYLIVVQDRKNGPLPFLNLSLLSQRVEIRGSTPRASSTPTVRPIKDRTFTVTELVKFIPPSIFSQIQSKIQVNVCPGSNEISLNTLIECNGRFEDVSAILGTLVPVIRQGQLQPGTLSLISALNQLDLSAHQLGILDIKRQAIQMYQRDPSWENLVRLITIYNCIMDRYTYPITQITHYSWISEMMTPVLQCVNRLEMMTDQDQFEKPIQHIFQRSVQVEVLGSIDCYQNDGTVWEIKVTKSLTQTHLLQSVVYLCLLRLNNYPCETIKLFNCRTDELWTITLQSKPEDLLHLLIDHKLKSSGNNLIPFDELLLSIEDGTPVG